MLLYKIDNLQKRSMDKVKIDLKKAIDALWSSAILLFPSDYGWGLCCDATNNLAVEKLIKVNKTNSTDKFLILVDHPSKLQSYVDEVPDIAWDLIELSENPISFIFPKAKNISENLLFSDGSAKFMICSDFISSSLCRQLRKPLAFTTANFDKSSAPLLFEDIDSTIVENSDYIIDIQNNKIVSRKEPSIIRLGKGNLFEIIKK